MTSATPLLFGHDASAGEVIRSGWPVAIDVVGTRGGGKVLRKLLKSAGRKGPPDRITIAGSLGYSVEVLGR